MKIAIHYKEDNFSERWIKYCEENRISYKIVNCYDTDIISQLDDCDGLMWHWSQNDYKAALFARQLTQALEKKGIKVFPNVNSVWHYDDKVGQKYLLESIKAPFVNSYVFYNKTQALNWIESTSFPKVFKLRGGAASVNVMLVKTKREGRKLIRRAFGCGFKPINRISRFKNSILIFNQIRSFKTFKGLIAGFVRILLPNALERFSFIQKGYVYFQDFIPNNKYDTRLTIIGNRCTGAIRYCRKNDFRASGSGLFNLDPKLFNIDCIKIAFETSKKLGSQSMAFDIILDNNVPKIMEMSYCFPPRAEDDCPGYWDQYLVWHEKNDIKAEYFMIEDFLNELTIKKNVT